MCIINSVNNSLEFISPTRVLQMHQMFRPQKRKKRRRKKLTPRCCCCYGRITPHTGTLLSTIFAFCSSLRRRYSISNIVSSLQPFDVLLDLFFEEFLINFLFSEICRSLENSAAIVGVLLSDYNYFRFQWTVGFHTILNFISRRI